MVTQFFDGDIKEALKRPYLYFDNTEDTVLIRKTEEDGSFVLLMAGQDDDGRFLLVLEDGYVSCDYYPEDVDCADLVELFDTLTAKM